MRTDTSILEAIRDFKKAKLNLEVYVGAYPKALAADLCRAGIKKCDFMISGFYQLPWKNEAQRNIILKEIKSDPLENEEIHDLVRLLPPEKKEIIIDVLNLVLSGEEIKIMDDKDLIKPIENK